MIYSTLFVILVQISLCKGGMDFLFVAIVGNTANLGYVDVYNGSAWNSLCYDGWEDADAAVVCRMLGYTGDGAQALTESNIKRFSMWRNKFDCIGNESHLQQCQRSMADTSCNNSNSMRIYCSTEKDPDDFFLLDIGSGIFRMDSQSRSITVVASGVSEVRDITYDEYTGMVIWTDTGFDQIVRCSINGGNNDVIYQAGPFSHFGGVTVDSISRMIFYADNGNDEIGTIHADNFTRNVIINTDVVNPYKIAFDPITKEIFWTDPGKLTIEKAFYNGSTRRTIVNDTTSSFYGLALDDVYVYWCGYHSQVVERVFRDGTDRTLIYNTGFTSCLELFLHRDYFYCRYNNRDFIGVYQKNGTSSSIISHPLLTTGHSSIYYHGESLCVSAHQYLANDKTTFEVYGVDILCQTILIFFIIHHLYK